MRPALVVALLVARAAGAETVEGSVSGEPVVWWDATGAFVFELQEGLLRYDVRSSEVTDVDAASPGWPGLTSTRTSPDGKASAHVELEAVAPERSGSWKDGTFTPAPGGEHRLVVSRGQRRSVTATVPAANEVSVFWSPDGQYVAWVVKPSAWRGMDGSAGVQVLVGAAGVRASIVAAKDILREVKAAVMAAAESAGVVVVFAGPARKARATSVVYAAKGFEDDARRVATALPGGGAVEPLTWDARAELVIAVGSSAAGGHAP